ncbi:MAG: putative DNA-binding protein [Mucilaginibacter sp.]|nr:putative DNA-binding protein [Mucilaginibacter sp.]
MTATTEQQQSARTPIQRDQLITLGDLLEFKTSLLQEFSALLEPLLRQGSKDQAKRWLKADEIRAMLRISAGKLQYLRDTGVIPYTKLGGITYYDYNEIVAIMESGKHENG